MIEALLFLIGLVIGSAAVHKKWASNADQIYGIEHKGKIYKVLLQEEYFKLQDKE
jgi:hypothetical protein